MAAFEKKCNCGVTTITEADIIAGLGRCGTCNSFYVVRPALTLRKKDK